MSSNHQPPRSNNPLKRRSGDEMSQRKSAKIEVAKVLDLNSDGDITSTVNLCLDFFYTATNTFSHLS